MDFVNQLTDACLLKLLLIGWLHHPAESQRLPSGVADLIYIAISQKVAKKRHKDFLRKHDTSDIGGEGLPISA